MNGITMNYTSLADTISPDLQAAVDEILNPEIEPEIRRYNLEILLREVGEKVYYNIYDMAAYDMMIEYTNGTGINDAYYGMAKNLSDSVSTGGAKYVREQLYEWLSNQIIKGEHDAFYTAKDLGQHPVLTRVEPADCCVWCRSLAGTHIDPAEHSELWMRHDNCRGSVSVSGYRSRNGQLSAYGNSFRKTHDGRDHVYESSRTPYSKRIK